MNAVAACPDEILVVDDTPASLKLLEDILTGAGYRARLATDGDLALSSARFQAPSLILLDIRMPGLDGYQVCQRLKEDERTRSIPVIFLSMLGDERQAVKAFEAGGVDYVNKPIRAAEVLARVHTHLALRRAQLDLEVRNRELEAARDTLEEKVKERSMELERSNEKLREAFAELEEFSYTVAHDLKTPLRAAHGFAAVLGEEYASVLPPEAARYAKVIQENAATMGRLIDGLLAFSRLGRQPLTKRPVVPEQLLLPLLDQSRSQHADTRPVNLTVHPLPTCQADPILLRRVFSNLLDNAFKFTRSRDVACIEIGSAADPADKEVIYYVKDNGVGFDMRYAEKLFGVFERLHSPGEFEGTGIGLAIVRRIVERHGGRVWAEGKLNEGATFHFALPRSAE
jgi:signal transduction histidine kinase